MGQIGKLQAKLLNPSLSAITKARIVSQIMGLQIRLRDMLKKQINEKNKFKP